VQPNLESLEVSHGDVLYESDSQLMHAYFPTTSIVSLLSETADGTSTEIAAVGNEGLVGITLFMGATAMQHRVVVQSGGQVHRLGAAILTAEFDRGGTLQEVLLRYTRARLTLIAQMAVCNQRHSIDQQLCRWLLVSVDRLASAELAMTHERLANTLGVRREGITDAANKLQAAGLIKCSRGRIAVVDRAGIEAYCCECYGVVRRAFDLLPAARASPLHAEPLSLAVSRDAVSRNHTPLRNGGGPPWFIRAV
jgi:CRP-like cAMP-binding protein